MRVSTAYTIARGSSMDRRWVAEKLVFGAGCSVVGGQRAGRSRGDGETERRRDAENGGVAKSLGAKWGGRPKTGEHPTSNIRHPTPKRKGRNAEARRRKESREQSREPTDYGPLDHGQCRTFDLQRSRGEAETRRRRGAEAQRRRERRDGEQHRTFNSQRPRRVGRERGAGSEERCWVVGGRCSSNSQHSTFKGQGE